MDCTEHRRNYLWGERLDYQAEICELLCSSPDSANLESETIQPCERFLLRAGLPLHAAWSK